MERGASPGGGSARSCAARGRAARWWAVRWRAARGRAAILIVLLAVSGCSRNSDDLFSPAEQGTIVVDATLIVGERFPTVYVSRTVRPDAPFLLEPVAGAMVAVRGPAGAGGTYGEASPGIYGPFTFSRVEPDTEYRLEVVTAQGEFVSARTRTPPEFHIEDWLVLEDDGLAVRSRLLTFEEAGPGVWTESENQLTYGSGLLEARFTRPDVVAFQVGIESLDLDSDFVIDPDFFGEEDFETLNRRESSPPFVADDGRLRLPWLAVYFEGRYVLRVNAIDRNWYDLVRSSPELGGGGFGFGGNLGDSFDRPIFNVNGGIGIFGSASVDSVGFYVHPGDGTNAPAGPASPSVTTHPPRGSSAANRPGRP